MNPLLQICGLSVRFHTDEGAVRAADDVSLHVERGDLLGLVGESGCGKSAVAMSIPRLLPCPPATICGSIKLDGVELTTLPLPALRELRGRRIGVIFQDPMTALSPLVSIGRQIEEAIRLHRRISRPAAREHALNWLTRVGIPEPAERARALPYQLSGGMQQRVMIAMALVHDPDLMIADEPTTALDVTLQAQVLDLMHTLHTVQSGMLLITHDMGVVRRICNRVAVMYAGEIVEEAPADACFTAPRHPYTRGLLAAIPSLATRGRPLPAIPGQVPSAINRPDGCRFRDRCPYACTRCATHPELTCAAEGHRVRCWLPLSPSPLNRLTKAGVTSHAI